MATIKYKTTNYPYLVYTALLTQSGGNSPVTQNSGLLGIGVTYEIIYNSSGMDFTNVGAPDNQVGTKFVATSDIPNSWGVDVGIEEILAWNEGAPVVTVLENTIGNITWHYFEQGKAGGSFPGEFIDWNKVAAFIGQKDANTIFYQLNSDYDIVIGDFVNNDVLDNTPIEIRVYGSFDIVEQ